MGGNRTDDIGSDGPSDGDDGPGDGASGTGSDRARKRPRRRRRALVITAWSAGGVLLVTAGIGGFAWWRLNGNLHSVNIDKALGDHRPAAAADGAQDILVLGSDSRAGANQKLGGGATDETARSDTAMVVHVDAGHRHAEVVSIPRDTLVPRPACTTAGGAVAPAAASVMFNSAFETGGAVCAVKTVEAMTGLRMDHYLEVDFAGFAKLVDALGGVTVTTTVPIHDKLSRLDLPAGTHQLGGDQALAFVRTRHGVGDGSDLGRIELQQQMVKAVAAKVEQLDLFTDPTKLFSIADAATSCVTTDSELGSVGSLVSFGESLRRIGMKDVTTVTLPTGPAPGDPDRLVAQPVLAQQLWSALRADRPVPADVVHAQIADPADS